MITAEQLQRITARLRPEIAALESQVEPVPAEALLDWYTGTTDPDAAKTAFLALPLAVRRRILLTTLGTGGSVVQPAKQLNVGGPGGLDTSTIEITWRWGFRSDEGLSAPHSPVRVRTLPDPHTSPVRASTTGHGALSPTPQDAPLPALHASDLGMPFQHCHQWRNQSSVPP